MKFLRNLFRSLFFSKKTLASSMATNAISLFTKATDQLEESTVLAKEVIQKNDIILKKLVDQNSNMVSLISTNKNVVININKLLVK